MPITWHDTTLYRQLRQWRDWVNTPGQRLVLHLFTDPAPAIGDDFDCTTLTEPTFPGYAPVTLDHWIDPVEDEPNAVWTTHPDVATFCRTVAGATVLVYGVFFTDEFSGQCRGSGVIWPDGIGFTTECDCYQIPVSKTDGDKFPGVG